MIGIEDSICKIGWLHRYELSRQSPEIVEEVCKICGKRVYYRIVDGRIDNLKYLRDHIRQALPRHHRLYYHEYPNKK